MLSEYSKALFKRVDKRQLMQFKPPRLPQRIHTKTLHIDNKHYSKYCEEVAWPNSDKMHPLYLQMLSLPLQMRCLLDKQSPFPLLGLIHCANDVHVIEDCDFSEPFECRVRFNDVRAHTKGWEVDIVLDALQNGQSVYRAVSSYLVKVKAVHVAPKPTHTHRKFGEQGRDTTSQVLENQQRELIAKIDATSDTGRRYASISGDYNPIHLSTLSAKLFGFKRAIAHGMWTLACVASRLGDGDESHTQDIKRIVCTFKKPVLLPEVLTIYRLPTHCPSAAKERVQLEVSSVDDTITHLSAQIDY